MNLHLIPQTPSKDERAARWEQIATHLRSRPGEWHVVYVTTSVKSAASAARAIRGGGYHSVLPDSVFEASARKSDAAHQVVARYVGEMPYYRRGDS